MKVLCGQFQYTLELWTLEHPIFLSLLHTHTHKQSSHLFRSSTDIIGQHTYIQQRIRFSAEKKVKKFVEVATFWNVCRYLSKLSLDSEEKKECAEVRLWDKRFYFAFRERAREREIAKMTCTFEFIKYKQHQWVSNVYIIQLDFTSWLNAVNVFVFVWSVRARVKLCSARNTELIEKKTNNDNNEMCANEHTKK